MTREIGWAGMPVRPTFDEFTPRAIESGTSRAMLVAGKNSGEQFGAAAGKSAGSRFGSVFKAGAKAALLGLGAAGAFSIKVGIDSVGLASDLAESENKVEQIFGKSADRIFQFSDKAAEKLGQTNQQARDAAATFGTFAGAAELSDKKSAQFSIRMTKLASDLASFNNTTPDQAIDALGAALRGESEPLRSYGVLLDDATLKAEAMAIGLLKPVKNQAQIKAYQVAIIDGQKKYNDAVKEHGSKSLEALKAEASLGTARDRLKKATEGTIEPLTLQQKVLAAQSAIFKQTSNAQGDFERTSDGLANRQRILTARITDAKTELGQGLLPVMEDTTGFILDHGVPAVEKFADWFSKKATPAIGDFIDDAKPLANDILPTVRDLVDDLVGGFGDLAPLAKNVFDGFNNLPDGVKKGLLVGGGLIAANKLLGGKDGNGGGAATLSPLGIVGATKGALVTKSGELLADKLLAKFQKPLPVVVMNPGFSGSGPGAIAGGAAGGSKAATSLKYLRVAGGLTLLGGLTILATQGVKEITAPSVKDDAVRMSAPPHLRGVGSTSVTPEQQAKYDAYKAKNPFIPGAGRADVDELISKVDVFQRSLDLAGSTKVRPDLAVPGLDKAREGLSDFIKKQIEAGRPVAPYINTTSIDRAYAAMKRLNDEIARNAQPERGVDGGVTYQHGGGTTTHGRAGVTNNFYGGINGSTIPDVIKYAESASRRRGHGGFSR